MSRLRHVAEAFVSLADTFGEQVDPLVLADRLVAHCVRLTGATAAGIMMVTARGRLRTVAVSDQRAELLEMLQLQTGEGPCVDCRRDGQVVAAPDLALSADRWPRFTVLARAAGFVGAYGIPVRIHGQVVGALNLLCAGAVPLTDDDLDVARAFAEVTATAMMQWRSDPARPQDILTRVQSVVAAKASVETAQGMLAAAGGLSLADALGALHAYSRQGGVRPTSAAQALLSRALTPEHILSAAARGARP
ncbi:GAF domain-containing protein [Actinacidiphila sp. ITFR-21]|uniref:GAF domain-containing protein n=1 Tax=Actinacidiphila sp. ITFR-21 TaxID=3075199 RepID=UPI00288B13DD|nr:GAF domain-containing protein [Streptomyces sp. ITFR-21]WNI14288.1 GAF domain-containing protein [Streptomyces sp. ITFR-21]